jgi:hypothetical protein
VKRAFSIFLLSLYVFATAEFQELLKLPQLAEHYAEHREKNPQISFWEFLDMHYSHGKVADEDYKEDMKLPFKTTDDCGHLTVTGVVTSAEEELNITPFANSRDAFPIPTDFSFPSPFLGTIFQPPKNA